MMMARHDAAYQTTVFPAHPDDVQGRTLAWAQAQALDLHDVTPTSVTGTKRYRLKIGLLRAIGEWLVSVFLGLLGTLLAAGLDTALFGNSENGFHYAIYMLLASLFLFGVPLGYALFLAWRMCHRTVTIAVQEHGGTDGVQITVMPDNNMARALALSLVATLDPQSDDAPGPWNGMAIDSVL
jgi:hypothetical protein